MILGFKFFDPLNGELPEDFPEFAGDIVYRARDLLDPHSENEIYRLIPVINWMIDESPAPYREGIIELGRKEAKDSQGIGRFMAGVPVEPDVYSATFALTSCIGEYDITGDEALPNASWAQLFAILALGLTDQACKPLELHYGSGGSLHADTTIADTDNENRIPSSVSYFLIQAMDAVATAEGFRRAGSEITESKQKIKIRSQRAAIQRHAKTNEAILALNKFYDPEKHKSMRYATDLFCEANPDKVKHLFYHNQLRTMTEGLSKYRKGQRFSLKK
jgi:hypothetical protein